MGAQHCPLGLHALWGLRAAGLVGGRPRGRWPATVVRGVWCQALSLPRPPVLRGGQPGFRDPVCPGCGRCGRGDPATAPQRAPLRARDARCGGGGRAAPGGMPFAVVRGVWGQALPLPRLPARQAGCRGPLPTCCGRGCAGVVALHWPRGSRALWGAARHGGGGGRLGSGAPPSLLAALWAGCRGPLATCCGRGYGCVRCAWCLCGVCRGAWCSLSPVPLVPPSPVLCCAVVLAVCLPCPLSCDIIYFFDASGTKQRTPTVGCASVRITWRPNGLHVEHHTGATIFGASSHGELRTLADAATATPPPAAIRPRNVWVVVDATVDIHLTSRLPSTGHSNPASPHKRWRYGWPSGACTPRTPYTSVNRSPTATLTAMDAQTRMPNTRAPTTPQGSNTCD